ncbi:MAG: hypothetical protein II408_04960, partial [Bacteroidales bacterium]|nr:hypothetical protein [Bacteroidales bacterium]
MDSDLSVYYCALSRVFAYKCAAGRHLLETFGGPMEAYFAPPGAYEAVPGLTAQDIAALGNK